MAQIHAEPTKTFSALVQAAKAKLRYGVEVSKNGPRLNFMIVAVSPGLRL